MQYHSNRSCAAMSFTNVTIRMAISRATSELGNSALRPKQELAVGTFCEEATCWYRFQQIAARVHATVCYPGPSIFSGNGPR